MKPFFIGLFLSFSLVFAQQVNAQTWNGCPGAPYIFPWCWNWPSFLGAPQYQNPTPVPSSTPLPSATSNPSPSVAPSPTSTSTAALSYGAYVGDGIENLTNVDSFESLTNKPLGVILVYEAWEGDWANFRPQWINNAYINNSIPMITWEPWNYSFGVTQSKYSLANITAGNFDPYITQWAQDAKANGKLFYLRPMHEMNGNWYPWSESANNNRGGDYVKAWKHIVDIFRRENATNAKFVWCPNVNFSGSTDLSTLYPGDSYVDYVCIDGYNWGDINGGWQSFNALFSNTYNQVTQLSTKTVIIGEMASAEIGGSKAAWITDAYTQIKSPSYNKIILVNWFNASKEKDWRVNSSATSLSAYKAAIQ